MEDLLESTIPRDDAADQDASWVAASRRGDTLSFNRLVLKWETRVYNLTLRMLQDTSEAEEATQEVFLSAYRNLRRFRGDARFSSWLYRIAANHCLSRLRKRPLPVQPLGDRELPEEAASEDRLLRAERRSQVHGALARLDPAQRVVVELKFFQEQTFDEIAAILSVPVSTVKSRFYTSLELLRRRLGTLSVEE